VSYKTAIDCGAGDCAGAYLMSQNCSPANVLAVDSSEQTKTISASMGMRHAFSLDGVEPVDFLYASHSIEHVADMHKAMTLLENAVRDGGYLFLETPNIADRQVFDGIIPTPHTFMLSESSFRQLCASGPLRMIAATTSGPEWSKHHKIGSQARTDLRILLRKTAA
jgi:trans-aconitate methyltransferase